MASTFMGLNISYSGLVASNAALNTTANNIANVESGVFQTDCQSVCIDSDARLCKSWLYWSRC